MDGKRSASAELQTCVGESLFRLPLSAQQEFPHLFPRLTTGAFHFAFKYCYLYLSCL